MEDNICHLPMALEGVYIDVDPDTIKVEWVDEDCLILHFNDDTSHMWYRKRGTWIRQS